MNIINSQRIMVIDKLFMLCVHFLEWLGNTTGLNYKQISVVFNIYIQGGILFVSSWLPLIKVISCDWNLEREWSIFVYGGNIHRHIWIWIV